MSFFGFSLPNLGVGEKKYRVHRFGQIWGELGQRAGVAPWGTAQPAQPLLDIRESTAAGYWWGDVLRCAWGHWDFGGGGEPSRALGPPVGPPGWVSDPGVVPGARGGRLAAFLDEPGGWSNCPENGNCWFLLPPPHFRGLTPAQETGLRGQRASRQPKSRLCPAPGPWVPSEHPWVPRVPP